MALTGMGVWLVVMFFVSLPTSGSGFCDHFPITRGFGGIPYCQYETGSMSQPISIFLLPGWNYVDETKCLNCTCMETELQCCGYGIQAGVMDHQYCEIKMIDSCNFVLVRKDNKDVPC